MHKKKFLVLILTIFIVVAFVVTSCDLIKKETPKQTNTAPNEPSSPVPADGATSVSINTLLSWVCSDPDGDVLSYDLYFGENEQNLVLKASNLTSNSYQLSNLEYSKTYYWKVVAKDTDGKSAIGPVWSFTTEPHPNRAPKFSTLSPLNNSNNVPLDVFLSWNAYDEDGDTVTYDIYFGTNPNPSLIKQNVPVETFQPITEFELSYNTYYYWKVVAKDTKGAQTSSDVMVFKTQMPPNNPPVTPSNGWPSNVTNMPLDLTLSWTCSDPDGDNLTYDLYFGTSSNPSKILNNYSGNSYTLHSLNGNTTYYWKVVAKDGKGGVTSGPVWSFTTLGNNPPSSPNLTNPANGQTNVPVNGVTLQWNHPSTDPDAPDPDGDSVYYDLYFGTNPNPPLYAGHLYGTSYALPRLNYSTTYYWKVIARDGKGGSTSSGVSSFTTDANQAPQINSMQPSNNSNNQLRANLALNWSVTDSNNDNWTVDVYLGTNPVNLQKIADGLTGNSYVIKDVLAANTTYYWQIVVKDQGGLSTTSSLYNFTTGK